MTTANESNRIDYDPDGIQTVFPYDFEVDDAAWMIVYADGSLYESNPFTVSGIGVPEGGAVTFMNPPDVGITTLTLIREVPMSQETSYPVYGPFPAKSHENALDKLTWIAQQQQEELNRAFVAPIDEDPGFLFVPAANVSVDDDAFTIKGSTQQILDGALDTQIATNVQGISDNAAAIGINAGLISDNAGLISDNAGLISDNSDAIGINAGLISDNSDAIGINAGLISDNSDAIGVNARPDVGNYIIDGDFNFWYEGVSQTSSGYGSDTMWNNGNIGSTKVHTREPFDLGQAVVPGNPKYLSRTVVTSIAGVGNQVYKQARLEDVTKISGETITLSFYAAEVGSKSISVEFAQQFGTGGSPSPAVFGIGVTKIPLTPTMQKHTVTAAIPSVTGKTLGTDGNDSLQVRFWFDAGSNFDARTDNLGQQSGTFDIARVRLVEGTVDGDDIDETYAEVVHKVDYYVRMFGGQDINEYVAMGSIISSLNGELLIAINMRSPPSLTYSDLAHWTYGGIVESNIAALSISQPSTRTARLVFEQTTVLPVGDAIHLRANATLLARLMLDSRL